MQKYTISKNKENPYVMLNKKPLDDVRLSWKAKGIWAYLLSKPDNWTVRPKDIENRSKDGREAVASALNELEQFGYVVRTEVRDKGKFMGFEYTIFEEPQEEKPPKPKRKRKVEPQTENPSTAENIKPQTGKPLTVKPLTENPQHSNKGTILNTDLIINTTTNSVVVPILNNTDGDKLPKGISKKLIDKLTALHGSDVVDRQLKNLIAEQSKGVIKNPAGWLTTACSEGFNSATEVDLFKKQENEKLAQELLIIAELESSAGIDLSCTPSEQEIFKMFAGVREKCKI